MRNTIYLTHVVKGDLSDTIPTEWHSGRNPEPKTSIWRWTLRDVPNGDIIGLIRTRTW